MTLKGNLKSRQIFSVVFVLLTLVVISAVFAWRFSLEGSADVVDFICRLDSHNSTFAVPVVVNLDDGMDRNEAITVAEKVFQNQMTNATYIVKSVQADDDGVWTVELSWELGILNVEQSESLGHYFDVTINPSNREVSYTRCY